MQDWKNYGPTKNKNEQNGGMGFTFLPHPVKGRYIAVYNMALSLNSTKLFIIWMLLYYYYDA